MKKSAILHSAVIITILLACRCTPVTIPLKSNYNESPVEIATAKSIDSIWWHLAALFESNGLPIKKMDRDKDIKN